MALTIRQNGSTSASLVTAAWWNDYYTLLTGTMYDQLINPTATIQSQAITTIPPGALTAAATSGSGLGTGTYLYAVALAGPNGMTLPGTQVSVTTTSTNARVNLTGIPTYSGSGAAGVTQRILYRTKVGGTQLYQLATINDNTTTTYLDAAADTTLSVIPGPFPTLGGTVQVLDGSDVMQASMSADGQVYAKTVYRWAGTTGTQNRQVLDMVPTDSNRIGMNYNYNGGSGGIAFITTRQVCSSSSCTAQQASSRPRRAPSPKLPRLGRAGASLCRVARRAVPNRATFGSRCKTWQRELIPSRTPPPARGNTNLGRARGSSPTVAVASR